MTLLQKLHSRLCVCHSQRGAVCQSLDIILLLGMMVRPVHSFNCRNGATVGWIHRTARCQRDALPFELITLYLSTQEYTLSLSCIRSILSLPLPVSRSVAGHI